MKLFLSVVLAFLVAGCVSSGTQISQDAALQFKEGVSTDQEIISKLGQPSGTTISGGKKFMSYAGAQCQTKAASFIPIVGAFAGGADCQASSALYQIGANGVLEKITYSGHISGSRSGATPATQATQEPTAIK